MGATALQFGAQLRLIATEWAAIEAAARAVDAGPWRSLWTGDHLVAVLGDERADCYEAWSVLAGLTRVTERVRLGVLVSPVTFRHPVVLAKMAATLDQMCGGRLEIGLGAGYHRRENAAYGLAYPPLGERSQMLEEACELTHRLLTAEEPVDYAGKHYRLERAVLAPRCLQQPRAPLVIAGGGERRTLRTVARYGEVMNVVASTPADLRRKIAVLERHCAEAGRDPSEIRKTILTFLHVTEDAEEEARLRERYGVFVRTPEAQAALPIGQAGRVVEALAAFQEAGAEEVIITDLPNDPEVYAMVASEVIGQLAAS